MRIGLFLPNWLGDLVMATPSIRAIRRHFGREAELVGILRPHLRPILEGSDWLDAIWDFHPRGPRQQARFALIRRMRASRFDLVVLMTNSLHTALLAWAGGARERVGFIRDCRGLLLTRGIRPPWQGRRIAPMPVVDYYLKLADELGCAPESPRLELPFTKEDESAGQLVWEQLGLRADNRVVVVNSSGAFGAAKIWPTEHAAVLARRIAEELDHDVIVLCGPREREAAWKAAELAGHPRVFAIPPELIGIPTSKACIRRCRAMVSTDSGPRHIAAAFGKPVVTLFGPTDPVWVENPTVRGIDLRLDLECIGCRRRVCPLGHHRCMNDLLPGMVFCAVERLLAHAAPQRPRVDCCGQQAPCMSHRLEPSRIE